MSIIKAVAEAMQAILNERADELARETQFIKRQRQMTGSGFVQALVFGFLSESDASVETLAQSARNVNIKISRQGLHQRFTPEAAAFLERVLSESLGQVIVANPVQPSLLCQFSAVYVIDSTLIVLPAALESIWRGCEGSALKLTVCWDLRTGQLVQVYLHHGAEHDQQAPLPELPVGGIWLRDLGYFNLDALETDPDHPTWWCLRYKIGTLIYDEHEQPLNLLEFVETVTSDTFDITIYLGKQHRIRCRLVGGRVPPEQLQRRQAHLRRWERRQQKQASAEKWALLAWSFYVTNTDPHQLSAMQAMVMIRVRWQIELLFKLWKDVVDVDDWTSQHPWRILCEVYAKLIACIVQHWLLLCGDVHALHRSMTQATAAIRHLAWALAYSLPNSYALHPLLKHLTRVLRQSAFISTSSNSPPTFQRLREA